MKPTSRDRYLEQEFMRLDSVNHAPATNAAARLDRREAERVPLCGHVAYVSEEDSSFQREGRLLNVSMKGCRVVGSVLGAGTAITISLQLGDGKPSLNLAGAMVRWEDGSSFGVKFPTIRGEARQRLQELVLKFATRCGSSQDHTAFRLA